MRQFVGKWPVAVPMALVAAAVIAVVAATEWTTRSADAGLSHPPDPFQITSSSVNGGDTTTVAVGGMVTVSLTVDVEEPEDSWEATEYRFNGGTWICVDHADHHVDGESETFDITAPAVAGAYTLELRARDGTGVFLDDCHGGISNVVSHVVHVGDDNDSDGIPNDEDTEGPPGNTNGVGGADDCTDGVDNDGDGLIDGDDPGCEEATPTPTPSPSPSPSPTPPPGGGGGGGGTPGTGGGPATPVPTASPTPSPTPEPPPQVEACPGFAGLIRAIFNSTPVPGINGFVAENCQPDSDVSASGVPAMQPANVYAAAQAQATPLDVEIIWLLASERWTFYWPVNEPVSTMQPIDATVAALVAVLD